MCVSMNFHKRVGTWDFRGSSHFGSAEKILCAVLYDIEKVASSAGKKIPNDIHFVSMSEFNVGLK